MIHLICTFEPSRTSLLTQFVEHYRLLGVERFHLTLHCEPTVAEATVQRYRREAQAALDPLSIALTGTLIEPFTSFALRANHDRIQEQECHAGDWVICCDIDEFQVYPGDFRALLDFAASLEIDYFRGSFVDRITEDGTLADFDPSRSIWLQYPRLSRISHELTGDCNKVACARPHVRLTPGNHYPINDEPLRYYSELVEIHHFKWDSSVVGRLSRRLQPDFQEKCPWWVESKNILDFIERNKGVLKKD
jgi:hypothetical protein